MAGSVASRTTVTESEADWKLWLQFIVYSIDLKTETLFTSDYKLEFWSFDNTSVIGGAIFKSDKIGPYGFLTGPIEGTKRQRFHDEITTNPTNPIHWEWRLHPCQRLVGLGSPFDRYELSFLIALNETAPLRLNSTDFLMPTTLRGDWESTENLERLTEVPTNGTLRLHGIDPETFAFYKGDEMVDFYLYTVVLEPLSTNILRMTLMFLFPPIVIFVLLMLVAFRYGRLRRSDLLRIYLAITFFILPFWVSFYQHAPPRAFTWQELFFLLDFCFATLLISHTIVLKKEGNGRTRKEAKSKSSLITSKKAARGNSMHISDGEKEKLGIEKLIAQINTRESSTLVLSTVASSISLTILSILFDKSIDLLMRWGSLGLSFGLLGFLYRELTIHFSEIGSYRELRRRARELGLERILRLEKDTSFGIYLRMVVVRLFFLLPLATFCQLTKPSLVGICIMGALMLSLMLSIFELARRVDC